MTKNQHFKMFVKTYNVKKYVPNFAIKCLDVHTHAMESEMKKAACPA
jgi:hypothetical protein